MTTREERQSIADTVISTLLPQIKFESNIIDHFPYTPYPTQIIACDQIQQAIKDGKTDIILEAPTGSGKSLIAIAVSRWLSHELDLIWPLGKPKIGTGCILTAEKVLQEQYTMEFDYLACAMGRGNYPCNMVEGKTAAVGRCKVTKKRCDYCEYYSAIDGADIADISTLNYHVFLYVNKHKPFTRRPLFIFDEAHAIEDVLMGFVDMQLSQKQLTALGVNEKIPEYDNLREYDPWLRELKSVLTLMMNETKEHWAGRSDSEINSDEIKKFQYGKDMKLCDDLERINYKAGVLVRAIEHDYDNWVSKFDYDDKTLIAKPKYIHKYHNSYLMPHAGIRLYMSATLFDFDVFCNNLGIEKDNATFIEIPHTFPVDNRLVIYSPAGKMSYANKKATLPNMVKYIKNIADGNPDHKGIIHAFTWEITEYIMKHTQLNGRLITHTTKDRIDAVDRFRASNKPLILVSPSLYTGINLKDDDSRFAIICKIPFGSLSDIQIKARKELDPGWYNFNTIAKMLQAYGRSIRHKEDWCVTYILDGSFEWFYNNNKFPNYFDEVLRKV